MNGYVEHDGERCRLGAHSNRGPVSLMCPVYLEVRRYRLAERMREVRLDARLAAGKVRLVDGTVLRNAQEYVRAYFEWAGR